MLDAVAASDTASEGSQGSLDLSDDRLTHLGLNMPQQTPQSQFEGRNKPISIDDEHPGFIGFSSPQYFQ